jgi:hypothetical protein
MDGGNRLRRDSRRAQGHSRAGCFTDHLNSMATSDM